MRPLCRYSIRLLAGLLLSQGALGLAHADEPSTMSRWDEASKSWVRMAVAKPGEMAPAALPTAQAPVVASPKPADAGPPPAVTVIEGMPAPAAGPSALPPSPFAKVPVITPMPRPGNAVIPPDGPGYYSLYDVLTGNFQEKRPKQPYGPVGPTFFPFFDADFRYLDDPNNTQHNFLDVLHRIHVNDNWVIGTGGEFRYRFMSEFDSRLTGNYNSYNLLRERVYADVAFQDRLRAYVEFIGANTNNYLLTPLPIDRNQADILNLFLDAKVMEVGDNPLTVRVGRQELLYGSQRLISPLDWANTQRTFQGVKAFWHSEKWDIDGFWVKPVIVSVPELDSWSLTQNFWGAWATYKPKKGTSIDAYLLNFSNSVPVAGTGGNVGGLDITTFGMRTTGDVDGRFLWDFEGMVQTGERANQNVIAGSFTTSLGYRAKCLPWTPTLWVTDDWASGNRTPGVAGTSYTTFNQLFPFGHYYGGFIDFVGRQNINDFNMQFSFCPTKWVTGLLQFHNFNLVSPFDNLYNKAGAVIRTAPAAGNAGTFVGNELDVAANIHLTQYMDFLVGYSRFFSGTFIQNTGSPLPADLYYLQYSLKW